MPFLISAAHTRGNRLLTKVVPTAVPRNSRRVSAWLVASRSLGLAFAIIVTPFSLHIITWASPEIPPSFVCPGLDATCTMVSLVTRSPAIFLAGSLRRLIRDILSRRKCGPSQTRRNDEYEKPGLGGGNSGYQT